MNYQICDYARDILLNYNRPVNTIYIYYNIDTKKIDTTTFLDYKKWYNENKAFWKSEDYGHALFKFEYLNDKHAKKKLSKEEKITRQITLKY